MLIMLYSQSGGVRLFEPADSIGFSPGLTSELSLSASELSCAALSVWGAASLVFLSGLSVGGNSGISHSNSAFYKSVV